VLELILSLRLGFAIEIACIDSQVNNDDKLWHSIDTSYTSMGILMVYLWAWI